MCEMNPWSGTSIRGLRFASELGDRTEMRRLTAIWKHCPRRVYAGARQTLEVVLAARLDCRRRRPNAAKL